MFICLYERVYVSMQVLQVTRIVITTWPRWKATKLVLEWSSMHRQNVLCWSQLDLIHAAEELQRFRSGKWAKTRERSQHALCNPN